MWWNNERCDKGHTVTDVRWDRDLSIKIMIVSRKIHIIKTFMKIYWFSYAIHFSSKCHFEFSNNRYDINYSIYCQKLIRNTFLYQNNSLHSMSKQKKTKFFKKCNFSLRLFSFVYVSLFSKIRVCVKRKTLWSDHSR